MTRGAARKALFLDRDGVINHDHGYVYEIKNFHFIDGIFELVRHAGSRGYLVFVVTNQAGIGRGYYSEKDFNYLTDWMLGQFRLRKAKITKVYFSPYHPTHGVGCYLNDHDSRKPKPGMILAAKREFNLDLEDCVLVGDKFSDIEAGTAAGVGRNFFLGSEHSSDRPLPSGCSFIKGLQEVTRII